MVAQSSSAMPMDISHKQALAALDPATLTALKEPVDGPGLMRLAIHLLLLAMTGSLVAILHHPLLLIPALVLHGIVLVFLFTLEHEAIHGTAFRTAAINRIVAECAGFLLLLPPRYFRYFHFAHHRHTQDAGLDPELAAPRPRDVTEYAIHLSGIPYWRAQIAVLTGNALGRTAHAFMPIGGRAAVKWEARLYFAAYASLAIVTIHAGWIWPLWYWLIPAVLGQPFLRAYLLAEHAACPLVADMLENTRTTFTNRAINLLAWNMPHHTAHHALPVVPFHRLPQLTERLRPHLKVTAEGYVDAHRHIRAVWKRS